MRSAAFFRSYAYELSFARSACPIQSGTRLSENPAMYFGAFAESP